MSAKLNLAKNQSKLNMVYRNADIVQMSVTLEIEIVKVV